MEGLDDFDIAVSEEVDSTFDFKAAFEFQLGAWLDRVKADAIELFYFYSYSLILAICKQEL